MPKNLNTKLKKKERVKVITGAWITSDNNEYLLDGSLAPQLVNLFSISEIIPLLNLVLEQM